ncbi:helix-hairpin-helix domain-containing protein [Natronorubrum halophilum]|uniref:helix-hairpin-helix domain-containing protein n=1 Tax=Natronorubrum halophilum TaxID=1702106 RepID=UPI0010C20956|nr:helix-hairpin-helix domain-containing protein [Natronorubrum halophilum]
MADDLTDISGIGPAIAESLRDAGYETTGDVMTASADELADVHGIGEKSAKDILTREPGAGGRDPKLTHEVQTSIANMLQQGQSVAAACRCNGIGQTTFYEWLEKADDQEEGIYADFADEVASARGMGEAQLVDDLLEMARENGDARTILSVLKNRYSESWGEDDGDDTDTGSVEVYLTSEKD